MAVGGYTLNGHNPGLSQMLTRGHWVSESVPSPSQGVNVFANEVSCASPASCLFVGEHFAGQRGPASNLAEAWNGSSWRIVTATGPAGAAFSALDDVACPTTRFCLAVGFSGPARIFQDTAYTWINGTTWRRITVPRPHRARNSALGGLACFDARNCMAVGNYVSASGRFPPFAVRWHDGRWKLLTAPARPRGAVHDLPGDFLPGGHAVRGGRQHRGLHPQYPRYQQEALLFSRLRRGLERRQLESVDVPPGTVVLHRRLVPGAQPLLRVRLHVPCGAQLRAPADRDLERPDLDDSASGPDLRAPCWR